MTGLTRTLLTLQQPGVFAAFRQAFLKALENKCQRLVVGAILPLDPIAEQHRCNTLRFFGPPRARAKAVVQGLSEKLFNGNWLHTQRVTHRCTANCCTSHDETVQKMKVWGRKLLNALGRRILNRANWLAWHHSFPLVGFLMSLHGLFYDAFEQAISKVPVAKADVVAAQSNLDEDGEKIMQWRIEQAEHRQKAADWLQSGKCFAELYTIRVTLDTEIFLIEKLVSLVAARWELHNLSSQAVSGQRSYRVQVLGEILQEYKQRSAAILVDASIWSSVTVTEADISRTWKGLFCPTAVVYQLFELEVNSCPLRTFRLLSGSNEEALQFLQLPACLLDEFSSHFRALHNTVESIQSDDAQEVLAALAHMAETNTFKTEVLHSVNGRRLSTRHHTHAMDLPTLAWPHFASTSPGYMRSTASSEAISLLRERKEHKSQDKCRTIPVTAPQSKS
eukprot:6490833-Amphidinium_carterae.1